MEACATWGRQAAEVQEGMRVCDFFPGGGMELIVLVYSLFCS